MTMTLDELNAVVEAYNGKSARERRAAALDLSNLTSIPEGAAIDVHGDLYLDGVTNIPVGVKISVYGDLWADHVTSISEGVSITVYSGNMDMDGVTSVAEGVKLTADGDMFLGALVSAPKGFSPVVGVSLWMHSLGDIPKGFNPTVGRSLHLFDIDSNKIPEGGFPNVKGHITWRGKVYGYGRARVSLDGMINDAEGKRVAPEDKGVARGLGDR